MLKLVAILLKRLFDLKRENILNISHMARKNERQQNCLVVWFASDTSLLAGSLALSFSLSSLSPHFSGCLSLVHTFCDLGA